jgi:hypothetical protein
VEARYRAWQKVGDERGGSPIGQGDFFLKSLDETGFFLPQPEGSLGDPMLRQDAFVRPPVARNQGGYRGCLLSVLVGFSGHWRLRD